MKKGIIWFLTLLIVFLEVVYWFGIKQDLKKDFFSIVVLPDTQRYSFSNSDNFCKQTEWIVDNRDKFRIAFVTHVGDIVQSGALVENEWSLASRCMGKLDGVVPYAVLPGNHDGDEVDNPKTGYTKFNSYFGNEKYLRYGWYGGGYNGNRNNYEIVKMLNGEEWLFLSLEVDPTDEDLSWANRVLSENSGKRVILTTHAYIQDNDAKRSEEPHFRKGGNSGQEIWDKLVSKNCNIFLVVSGHFHNATGEARRVSKNICGNEVMQVIQDYQGGDNGGNGKLRIYSVYPKTNEVEVSTFSVVSNKFENDANAHFTFKI